MTSFNMGHIREQLLRRVSPNPCQKTPRGHAVPRFRYTKSRIGELTGGALDGPVGVSSRPQVGQPTIDELIGQRLSKGKGVHGHDDLSGDPYLRL